MEGPFLAVDWGTTNRRAWRVGADGMAEAEEQDGRGILAVAPGGFAAEAAAIRARLGDLPMLCAGMAGSNRGWVETPYLPCPLSLDALAGGGRPGSSPAGPRSCPASRCEATGPM